MVMVVLVMDWFWVVLVLEMLMLFRQEMLVLFSGMLLVKQVSLLLFCLMFYNGWFGLVSWFSLLLGRWNSVVLCVLCWVRLMVLGMLLFICMNVSRLVWVLIIVMQIVRCCCCVLVMVVVMQCWVCCRDRWVDMVGVFIECLWVSLERLKF